AEAPDGVVECGELGGVPCALGRVRRGALLHRTAARVGERWEREVETGDERARPGQAVRQGLLAVPTLVHEIVQPAAEGVEGEGRAAARAEEQQRGEGEAPRVVAGHGPRGPVALADERVHATASGARSGAGARVAPRDAASRRIRSTTSSAESITMGSPVPGWVEAPTKKRFRTVRSWFEGRKGPTWKKWWPRPKALPCSSEKRAAQSSGVKTCSVTTWRSRSSPSSRSRANTRARTVGPTVAQSREGCSRGTGTSTYRPSRPA